MTTTRELAEKMLEAAALGICSAKCGIKEPQGSIRESAIKDHTPEARAALLAALRVLETPSEEMVRAGADVSMDISAHQVFHAWQAMIWNLMAALQGDTATGER